MLSLAYKPGRGVENIFCPTPERKPFLQELQRLFRFAIRTVSQSGQPCKQRFVLCKLKVQAAAEDANFNAEPDRYLEMTRPARDRQVAEAIEALHRLGHSSSIAQQPDKWLRHLAQQRYDNLSLLWYDDEGRFRRWTPQDPIYRTLKTVSMMLRQRPCCRLNSL